MGLYMGIDLHSNNGVYAAVDESGGRRGCRRLANDLPLVLEHLAAQPEPIISIAVESTFNWYWLVDGLMEAGHLVLLANPNAMDTYDGIKHQEDKHDAYFLAELQRLSILPTGYIYPKEERPLRDLLRRRMLLSKYATGLRLSLQNMLMRETGERWSWRQVHKLDSSELSTILDDELHYLVAQKQRGLIERIDAAMGDLEKAAKQRLTPRWEYDALQTAPGIGVILSAVIMLETGTIERFAKHGNYTSYSRLTDAKAISNGKKKKSNNRKNGNRYLCWAYAEAAAHARRCCEPARTWYQRKLSRCGGKEALAAKSLAAKWCKGCYFVLRNRQPFDLGRVFG